MGYLYKKSATPTLLPRVIHSVHRQNADDNNNIKKDYDFLRVSVQRNETRWWCWVGGMAA
jgi:hypothetical protein